MKVTFWGTRGSIPTVTKDTTRYGGNTPCVTIENGEHILILDAGSGIRALSESGILEKYGEINILLTHLHMDHIQGLGFFKPFFVPGRKIKLWGPKGPTHLFDRLNRYLSPPLFPVRIRDFRCDLGILDIPVDDFELGSFTISSDYICHPGPTLGIRVSNGGKTVAYIPDHEPAIASKKFPDTGQWTSGYNVAKDADLLIHDAQFTDEEYKRSVGWGHSSYSHVLSFADMTGASKLALFHHDPAHSDDDIDKMYAEYACADREYPVLISTEGEIVQV